MPSPPQYLSPEPINLYDDQFCPDDLDRLLRERDKDVTKAVRQSLNCKSLKETELGIKKNHVKRKVQHRRLVSGFGRRLNGLSTGLSSSMKGEKLR